MGRSSEKMELTKRYDVAGGSVIGREHAGENGSIGSDNNQDAYIFEVCDGYLFIVVCDGTSAFKHSDVGAKTLCLLVGNAIKNTIKDKGIFDLGSIQKLLLSDLKAFANILAGGNKESFGEIAQNYLLATIVAAVVMENETYIFGLGDGVYAINEEVFRLGPYKGNHPPYFGYRLYDESVPNIDRSALDLQLHKSMPTDQIETLMVGTDGVWDLYQLEIQNIRSGNIQVSLSEILKQERYAKGEMAIERYLRSLQTEQTTLVLR